MKHKTHPVFQKPIAHRGLHDAFFDENSLAAFANAIKHGFGIEIDVHLSRDDKVVVIHDTDLKRVSGHDEKIRDLTYEEIKTRLLFKTQTPPPLLSDVLSLINGQVPLLIEVKAEGDFPKHIVDELLAVLANYPYKDNVALQCFNPYVVKEMKEKQKEIIVGQLISDILEGQTKFVQFLFRSHLVLKISKPDFWAYDIDYIKRRKVQRKRKKLPLLVWTIDNPAKLARARQYADNIIFEKIEP